jgi:CelD/BcsL family acetyltransferase involved in cellulose biosynthesis
VVAFRTDPVTGIVRSGVAEAGRTLRLVNGLRGLRSQEQAWRRAQRAGLIPGPFDQFPIAQACAETAEAAGSRVVTVVADDGISAPSILPLRLQQNLGVRTAIALTAPISQYAPSIWTVVSICELTRITEALFEHAGIDLLLLRKVRRDNILYDALAIEAVGGAVETAPFVDLTAFGCFAAYERSFSNSTRRNRRQRRQRLEAQHGALNFEVLSSARAEAPLREALSWKAAWLNEHGISSAVLDDGLWREALVACAREGDAHVSVMTVGGRLAAVELGFARGDHYVAYLGAFDPELARFSVGQEQMARTIAWCFSQGFSRYDLLAPDDRYKRIWARGDSLIEVRDFMLPTSRRGRFYAYAQHGRPFAKRVLNELPTPVRRAIKWMVT